MHAHASLNGKANLYSNTRNDARAPKRAPRFCPEEDLGRLWRGEGVEKGCTDVGGRTVLYCNHMEPVQLAHPEVPHAEVVP